MNVHVCEGQDEVVAVLGTKLTKSLIRYIPLPPIYEPDFLGMQVYASK